MQLALRSGMGAYSTGGVSYVDTGDGLTPDNFQGVCCGTWFQNLFDPPYSSMPKCQRFMTANESLFAESFIGKDPCSAASQESLTTRFLGPPVTTSGPAPVIDSSGYAVTDPAIIAQQIAQAGGDQNLANNLAQAAALASAQCIAQKVTCENGMWGPFRKPTADCTACQFDITAPGSLALIGVVGLLLLIAIKR